MASSQGRFETFLLPEEKNKRCNHGNRKTQCWECKAAGTGGSSICEHDKRRSDCKKCKAAGTGGSGICNHGRIGRCQACALDAAVDADLRAVPAFQALSLQEQEEVRATHAAALRVGEQFAAYADSSFGPTTVM